MSALVNGWEKWEPTDDLLKKGKDLLRTNWTIIEINKKGKGKGRGEDDDDEGSDGYHSDKYDDVMDYELDNDNLKRVTGLKKLAGEEDAISEESDDSGVHNYVDAVAAGNKGGDVVNEEKDGVEKESGGISRLNEQAREWILKGNALHHFFICLALHSIVGCSFVSQHPRQSIFSTSRRQ